MFKIENIEAFNKLAKGSSMVFSTISVVCVIVAAVIGFELAYRYFYDRKHFSLILSVLLEVILVVVLSVSLNVESNCYKYAENYILEHPVYIEGKEADAIELSQYNLSDIVIKKDGMYIQPSLKKDDHIHVVPIIR